MIITEFTEFSHFAFITEMLCENNSSKTVENNFMKEHLQNQLSNWMLIFSFKNSKKVESGWPRLLEQNYELCKNKNYRRMPGTFLHSHVQQEEAQQTSKFCQRFVSYFQVD